MPIHEFWKSLKFVPTRNSDPKVSRTTNFQPAKIMSINYSVTKFVNIAVNVVSSIVINGATYCQGAVVICGMDDDVSMFGRMEL